MWSVERARRAWRLRITKAFGFTDRERQVPLSVLGIPIRFARNYLEQQSPARLDSAQAARENHPAQILATRLGEPRPPPIRKRQGARGELGSPTPVNFCELFLWKRSSQMTIAQSQRDFTAAKRVSSGLY